MENLLEELLEKKDPETYIKLAELISEKSSNLPKVNFKLRFMKTRYMVNTAAMDYKSPEGLRNMMILYYLTSNENQGQKNEIYGFITKSFEKYKIDYDSRKIKNWLDTQFADGKNHLRTDERKTKIMLIGKISYESSI